MALTNNVSFTCGTLEYTLEQTVQILCDVVWCVSKLMMQILTSRMECYEDCTLNERYVVGKLYLVKRVASILSLQPIK